MPRRVACALALVAVVPLGLGVRYAPLHLPWVVSKYTGSALWAVALYLLLGMLLPRLRPVTLGLLAVTIATATELTRLAHSGPIFSAIDRFRLTLAGRILIGRYFSLKDIAAYALAIAAAAALDYAMSARSMPRAGE